MKITINQEKEEIEVESILEKEIKPFSKTSAHVILPKKWIGYNVFVAIKKKTGQWLTGFREKHKKEKKVDFP